MTVVIGTAGHIDHGKTTLLRVLTGMDTDRLPEEQRRGLTIDIGYAHFSPDDDEEIDFVDVPGHDKLVGNMLVGAGEIDGYLLVVAADDGPRAQTWEHVALLDALGVDRGLIVVTKSDLVDPPRVAEVEAQLRERLGATALVGAPVLAVSAATGEGLDRLRPALAALRGALAAAAAASLGRHPRLAIDRAFSVHGHGVVVTGSSRGARIRTDTMLRAEPDGFAVRVRGLQVHDAEVERGPAGGRVALNVAGEDVRRLRRGHVLVAAKRRTDAFAVTPTSRLLVALQRPRRQLNHRDTDAWPPIDGNDARLHVGTDQADARVGRSGRDGVDLADGSAIAILRLDRPVAVAIGERFVLRRPTPAGLLAGGTVLDPMPARGRSRRRQTAARLRTLADAVDAGDDAATAGALLGIHGQLTIRGSLELASDVESEAVRRALDVVSEHHRANAGSDGIALAALRAAVAASIRMAVSIDPDDALTAAGTIVDGLIATQELVRVGDDVRDPDYQPPTRDPALDAAKDRLVARLDVTAPPALSVAAADADCPPAGIRELEAGGRIVIVNDDLAWSQETYDQLSSTALRLAAAAPLTPAALRDATDTSRKYVMALLEDLDRRGILRRTPAGHVPGPRARAGATGSQGRRSGV